MLFSIYLTILSVGHKHGSFFANVAVYKINKFFQCHIIRKDFIVFSDLSDLALIFFYCINHSISFRIMDVY